MASMHIAFAALSIVVSAHGGIRPEIAGEISWRVVSEQADAVVAYRETGRDQRTRQIWLVVTGRISGEIEQSYFVHTLDCANWTQTRDEYGPTDPAPRSWTPEEGPPVLRPLVMPETIRDGSPIAAIAEAVCRGQDLNLPTIDGDWETVTSALRERLTD